MTESVIQFGAGEGGCVLSLLRNSLSDFLEKPAPCFRKLCLFTFVSGTAGGNLCPLLLLTRLKHAILVLAD